MQTIKGQIYNLKLCGLIDETRELGKGAFGIVMKGRVTLTTGEEKEVAVKTVKKNVGIMYFKALLSEIKIMAHIGQHPNVIGLIGCCTENIRKREKSQFLVIL